jgi:shikimate kinase
MDNVVLIGMPGCGKSTIGVLLAKLVGFSFVDTDLLIQQHENKKLYKIIEEDGIDYFKEIENKINAKLEVTKTVIATGGSVVYGKQAMEHLKKIGKVIYLKVDYDELLKRIDNFSTPGIVIENGKTFRDLYNERTILYEEYADIIIECNKEDISKNAKLIASKLDLSVL